MNEAALLNRRDFLTAAALTAAGAIVARGAQVSATAPAGAEEWFDKPMRWVQLVLVDDDPGKYDPQFWLDYFKRIHADAICLSAGGCIAYYPTEIPYHYRSAWMKPGTDPFKELLDGCRKLDMVVVARTDSHSIRDDAATAHPEWLAVEANGQKRRHWAAPDRWVTCAYGPYNFQFMTDVHKEIVSKYQVEGIFTNRWQGSGMCYCESCQKQFRDLYNMDLPRGTDPQSTVGRTYMEWTNKRLFELWRLWDDEIRKINPQARYIANSGGGSSTSMDMVTISQLAPTLFADRQSRRGTMAPWANGKNGKEFRATFGRKPIVGIAALGIDDEHRWKDSVINEPELRIWLADGVANGLRPWVAKFCGQVFDKRWAPVIEKIYTWQWQNEKYLRNERNLARVAMVYSQQTGTYYGGARKAARVENHELGMYQALIEARIPFEMAHDRMLSPDQIDRYKLLILPNTAALSDAQCEQIRAYVRRGGNVLATFETSLYDEWGKRRDDFGLADLFGVSYGGNVQTDVKNSYMNIETQTNHAVLRGLLDAGRIINAVQWVDVKPVAQFGPAPLTRIPSYPDLPMEEVYPRVPKTDIAEIYLREIGKSRVVYFPSDLERTFWEILAADHGTLLRNAIEWATNEAPPAVVTGQGMLDVTVWEQKNSMTVHMVNMTNPMMFKAPYRELIPSPPQKVTVTLPSGKQAREVKLLVSGQSPQVERSGSQISVAVASILDHEVIAIDF